MAAERKNRGWHSNPAPTLQPEAIADRHFAARSAALQTEVFHVRRQPADFNPGFEMSGLISCLPRMTQTSPGSQLEIGARLGVKSIGKPCAEPHERFDGGGQARACSLHLPIAPDHRAVAGGGRRETQDGFVQRFLCSAALIASARSPDAGRAVGVTPFCKSAWGRRAAQASSTRSELGQPFAVAAGDIQYVTSL